MFCPLALAELRPLLGRREKLGNRFTFIDYKILGVVRICAQIDSARFFPIGVDSPMRL